MTPPLRRTHRTIWLLLAIALPVGFVAALRINQAPLLQEPIVQPLPAPLPVLIRSVTTGSVIMNLRRTGQGVERQIELLVKRPFHRPSAVVRVRQNGNWRAVGLLNAPGVYRFALPTTDNHPQVEIMDDVHGRTIWTIEF